MLKYLYNEDKATLIKEIDNFVTRNEDNIFYPNKGRDRGMNMIRLMRRISKVFEKTMNNGQCNFQHVPKLKSSPGFSVIPIIFKNFKTQDGNGITICARKGYMICKDDTGMEVRIKIFDEKNVPISYKEIFKNVLEEDSIKNLTMTKFIKHHLYDLGLENVYQEIDTCLSRILQHNRDLFLHHTYENLAENYRRVIKKLESNLVKNTDQDSCQDESIQKGGMQPSWKLDRLLDKLRNVDFGETITFCTKNN